MDKTVQKMNKIEKLWSVQVGSKRVEEIVMGRMSPEVPLLEVFNIQRIIDWINDRAKDN